MFKSRTCAQRSIGAREQPPLCAGAQAQQAEGFPTRILTLFSVIGRSLLRRPNLLANEQRDGLSSVSPVPMGLRAAQAPALAGGTVRAERNSALPLCGRSRSVRALSSAASSHFIRRISVAIREPEIHLLLETIHLGHLHH